MILKNKAPGPDGIINKIIYTNNYINNIKGVSISSYKISSEQSNQKTKKIVYLYTKKNKQKDY